MPNAQAGGDWGGAELCVDPVLLLLYRTRVDYQAEVSLFFEFRFIGGVAVVSFLCNQNKPGKMCTYILYKGWGLY